MSFVEAQIAETVHRALVDLGVHRYYHVTHTALTADGSWLARLTGADGYPDLSVSIEGDLGHPSHNSNLFAARIATLLGV